MDRLIAVVAVEQVVGVSDKKFDQPEQVTVGHVPAVADEMRNASIQYSCWSNTRTSKQPGGVASHRRNGSRASSTDCMSVSRERRQACWTCSGDNPRALARWRVGALAHGARVAAAQQHGDLRRQPRMIGRRHGHSITSSALLDVIGVFVLQ